MASGVVGGQLQRERRHRGDRAGQRRPACGASLHRHLGRASASAARMSASAAATCVGGRRVVVQVPLGQPHAADVDRAGRADAVAVAEDELGRAAADVDDQERRRGGAAVRRGRASGAPSERQLGLLVAGDHVRLAGRGWPAPCPRSRPRLAASRVALVATIRTPLAPSSRARAAYSASATRVRSIASGASRPVRSTPWPSRTTSIRAQQVGRARPAPARRRRAGGSSWCRSRSRRPGVTVTPLLRAGDAGPGRPPLRHPSPRPLVADRVDPGPGGQRVRRPARAGT